MATLAFRYTMIAFAAGWIVVLTLGAVGCSNDGKGLTPGTSGDGKSSEKDLNNPLLQTMDEVLDKADDFDGSEKSEARTILEKADPVLTRIKEENREALRRANNPPRKAGPKPEKQEAEEREPDKQAEES